MSFKFQQKMDYLNEEEEGPYFSRQPNSNQGEQGHSVMAKVARFIEGKQLGISVFWQSNRNCASANDIVSFCKLCGLFLPEYDVINLRNQVFASNQTIYVDQLAAYIPFWDNHQKDSVSQFLKRRSDMLLNKLQAKEKNRPKSSLPGNKVTSNSFKTPVPARAASANRFKRDNDNRPLMNKNNSKEYLKKYRLKEISRQKELHDSIEKNKIDQQFNMLVKMSQLNTINKERGDKTTYRAYKSAEGVIKVRIFNYNKFEKEISLNQFDTIFKNFKKSTKQNKEWTLSQQPNNSKPTDELQLLKNRNVQKSARQQQLKNLLVGTVNLTNLLKEQIKIFKEKGILGSQHI